MVILTYLGMHFTPLGVISGVSQGFAADQILPPYRLQVYGLLQQAINLKKKMGILR
jgi:hypothetical protein